MTKIRDQKRAVGNIFTPPTIRSISGCMDVGDGHFDLCRANWANPQGIPVVVLPTAGPGGRVAGPSDAALFLIPKNYPRDFLF